MTAIAATAIALGLGAVAAAAPAGAATARPEINGEFTNYVTTNGVNIRSGPSTSDTICGEAQTGQPLEDFCFTTSTRVDGYQDWDRVLDESTGVDGYVSECYLENRSQDTPC